MSFETPENFNPIVVPKEDAVKRFRPLTNEERKELEPENMKKSEESKEDASPWMRASWQNPENQTERKIEINIREELQFFEKLYGENFGLKIDQKEIISIWNKNYESMKKEIEMYGYDTVLIIPEDLPLEEILNRELIETMDEGAKKGKVNQTWQSDDFKKSGSFAGVKNLEKPKYRIILTKGEQNIYKTNDPLLKATLGKNMETLLGLTGAEITKKIQSKQSLGVDFQTEIGGKKIIVQAEGLSLAEYVIFQRAYFEKNQKHLDESGWTWLPKSFSGPRVVDASWDPVARQLSVNARGSSISIGILGLRLSRSFSK